MSEKRRYQLGDDPTRRRDHSTWHRGQHCNFTPSAANLAEPDAIAKYLLAGWAPEAPPVAADGNVLAVGSCFAQHVVGYLRRSRGKLTINEGGNVNLFAFGAGFVNTFTLRQQFEWALGKREIESATLFVEDPDVALGTLGKHRFKLLPADEATRAASRRAIMEADAYFITLGLSEVWYDRETGEVFFGAVPEEEYDPERHAFRVSTVEENRENLRAIYRLLRAVRPDAAIVFTVSPVRLTATFRPVGCLTANSVSKAVLRAAVDEMLRDEGCHDGRLYYWPSYEIVTDYYGHAGYTEDRRHVRPEVVDTIMHLFERHFIAGASVDQASPGEPKKPRSPRRRAQARRG